MSKILVTGHRGFIAGDIYRNLKLSDFDVIAMDVKTRSLLYRSVDITNPLDKFFKKNNITHIIHNAALKDVQESIKEPNLYNFNNIIGTVNLLQLAEKYKVKKFVMASSAAVYGDSFPNLKPLSPYGLTKKVCEEYCEMFKSVPTVCLRYFNVYGIGSTGGAIGLFIQKALKNEDITLFGDGGQLRDFVSVHDVVKANIDYCFNDKVGNFDIGSGVGVTMLELAETIIKLTNSKSEIKFLPAKEGDIRFSLANTAITPTISLEEGLKEIINYYAS